MSETMAPMSTDPAATAPNDPNQPSARKREDLTVVEVRRGVKLQGWIVAGIVLGILLSFVFAYFLPEHAEFSRGQVFGFLAVFLTALTVVVVTGIALVVNYFIARGSEPRRVVLERVPEQEEPSYAAEAEGGDFTADGVEGASDFDVDRADSSAAHAGPAGEAGPAANVGPAANAASAENAGPAREVNSSHDTDPQR